MFWSGPVAAAPHGLVVHLTLSAPAAGVVVKLEGNNEQKNVEMKDDGVSPDVTAGDSVYSGTTLVQADTVQVSLQLGDKTIAGGAVSWDPTQSTCDLNLKLEGENLTAEAAVPAPPVPQQPNDPAAEPPGSMTPPVGAKAPGTAPAGPAASPGPTGEASSSAILPVASDNTATVTILAGAAALLLAGLMYLSWSGGGGSLLDPLPEPGLLGPVTPSLSQGLSAWECPQEDSVLLAKLLLATLARQHRVLLLAPPDFQPDPVFGGPVYRAPSRPNAWKKTMNGLLEEGGLPLTVLCVGSEHLATLQRSLPEGVGGIFVGNAPAKMPAVRCQREGERWHLQSDAGKTMVMATKNGFEADS